MHSALVLAQVRGRTAVHAAVESGNLEIVERLITISPEARDIEDIVSYNTIMHKL